MEDIPYGEPQRVLLTFLRMVKCISVSKLTERFQILVEGFELPASTKLQTLISQINSRIDDYGFRIEQTRDQALGQLLYVFVNTRSDEWIQKLTPYLPAELEALNQVIESIVCSDNFSYAFPLRMAKMTYASLNKAKASEAQYFFERLEDEGWLLVSPKENLVLLPLSLVELKKYLVDSYGYYSADDPTGRMLKCLKCGDFVTIGKKCGTETCAVSYHRNCLAVQMRADKDCIRCGTSLEEVVTVGDKSLLSSEGEN